MNDFNEKSNLKGAWKKPFASDFATVIVIILKNIFSLLFFKGLNIIPFFIILLIIFGEWFIAIMLFIISLPLFIFRAVLKWFAKNHKDIKIKIINNNDFSAPEKEKDRLLIK